MNKGAIRPRENKKNLVKLITVTSAIKQESRNNIKAVKRQGKTQCMLGYSVCHLISFPDDMTPTNLNITEDETRVARG